MKSIKSLGVILSLVLLTACGGGSSSGGSNITTSIPNSSDKITIGARKIVDQRIVHDYRDLVEHTDTPIESTENEYFNSIIKVNTVLSLYPKDISKIDIELLSFDYHNEALLSAETKKIIENSLNKDYNKHKSIVKTYPKNTNINLASNYIFASIIDADNLDSETRLERATYYFNDTYKKSYNSKIWQGRDSVEPHNENLGTTLDKNFELVKRVANIKSLNLAITLEFVDGTSEKVNKQALFPKQVSIEYWKSLYDSADYQTTLPKDYAVKGIVVDIDKY